MNIRLIEHRHLHKKTVDTKFCITKDTLIGKTVIITDPHSSNYNKIGLEPMKTAVFKGREIRKIIHNNEWWFSVIDVVAALSDSSNPPLP